MGLSRTTLPAKRVVTGAPLTVVRACSVADAVAALGWSDTGDRADPQARAEAGGGQAARFEEADDPASVAGVGGQELEHPLVGAPCFAGQGPADQVRDV